MNQQEKLKEELQHKINFKTKPQGALGMLESIALKIGLIQETLEPSISNSTIVVFAGDHGIAKDGIVNPYPQEVTSQMVLNFLHGGAAINVFCRQHSMSLKVVDAGVAFDFEDSKNLIDLKVAKGTKNYLNEPAMSIEQCQLAMNRGAELIQRLNEEGCNLIGFGEMGIGNTSSASLLMSRLTGLSIDACVGKGTGLDDSGVEKKKTVLNEVDKKYKVIHSPVEVLATFGGFEIAMMCGAMLKAAELKMILLIDGFISTSAALVASKISSLFIDKCFFAHSSNEKGHALLLENMKAKPLLNLGMRLGEGTGCTMAYPLLQSAVNFLNEMASFENAGVSNKEE